MTMEKRKALGRGLGALIPGATGPRREGGALGGREYFECAIEDVHPAEDNPRQTFNEVRLGELAESIRTQGIVQPLVVRQRPPSAGGGFTLIAGERRWRAAQRAGLKTVPVVVKDVSGAQAYELTLVENLQREDLNPIEEAEAYHRLSSEFGYTQEQLAQRVGKDRATVANALRLLKLPPVVKQRLAGGELTMGHARALLGLLAGDAASSGEAAALERAAARVIAKQLSVRQTEQLVRAEKIGPAPRKIAPAPSASVRDLQVRLEQALGTKVRLDQQSPQAGTIAIEYHSLDQLDDLLAKLLRS